MIGNKITSIGLVFFAGIMSALMFWWSTGTFQVRETNNQLQAVVRASLYNNIDNSARAANGSFDVNKATFQKQTVQQIQQYFKGVQPSDVHFNYFTWNDNYGTTPTNGILDTSATSARNDSLRGVWVTLSLPNGKTYVSRYVVSLGKHRDNDITSLQQPLPTN